MDYAFEANAVLFNVEVVSIFGGRCSPAGFRRSNIIDDQDHKPRQNPAERIPDGVNILEGDVGLGAHELNSWV